MSLLMLAAIPLAWCVLLDTAEQLAYSVAGRRSRGRLGWLSLGVSFHLLALLGWLWLLRMLPLAIALPLRGASCLTITAAGAVILREQVNRRQWMGVFAIMIGLALVGGA